MELHTTKQDFRTYIDSVNNDRASYPEHNTLLLNIFSNTTVNSDSISALLW